MIESLLKRIIELLHRISTVMKVVITKGGSTTIYDATDAHISAISLYGSTHKSKNILSEKIPSKTENGITCTNNGDGTYTLNGTASGDAFFFKVLSEKLPEGVNFKIVGFSNPSNAKYAYINGRKYDDTQTYDLFRESVNPINKFDYEVYKSFTIGICVKQGTTVNNEVVKFMITTDLDATYADYEPYGLIIPSGKVASGNKNLLIPTLATSTINGITCTNNGDGTYTLNGTATGEATFWFTNFIKAVVGETLRFIGVLNGSNTTYDMPIQHSDNGSAVSGGYPALLNDHIDTVITHNFYRIGVRIRNGITVNNLIVKPMVTTDTSLTYVDYVKGQHSSIIAKSIIENFSLTAENVLNVFSDASGNKIENYKYQTFSSATSFDDTTKRAYFTLTDNALYNSEPLLSTDNTAKIWNPSNLKSMYIQYDDSYNLTKVNQELAANPLQVMYELPEQVVTELTDEEVAGMLSLQTYSDYTEITSDTDVTIKYFTDSENGREFSALQAKAVNFPAGVSLQNLEEEVIEDVSE